MTEEDPDPNRKGNKYKHIRIYAGDEEPEGCLGTFLSFIKGLLMIAVGVFVALYVAFYIVCGGEFGIKW